MESGSSNQKAIFSFISSTRLYGFDVKNNSKPSINSWQTESLRVFFVALRNRCVTMEIGPYGWLSGPVERRHLNVLATSRRTNRHSRCRISNARRRDGATTVRATFFIRRGHISGPIELSSSPPAPPVRRLAGRYKAVERRPASLVSPARPGPAVVDYAPPISLPVLQSVACFFLARPTDAARCLAAVLG